MTQEFKEKMQKLYDSFINSSNRAFENAGTDIPEFAKQNWEGKSEAYEYAAIYLDQTLATEGIYLESKKCERRKWMEQEQRDQCLADAESDVTEAFYHEEI